MEVSQVGLEESIRNNINTAAKTSSAGSSDFDTVFNEATSQTKSLNDIFDEAADKYNINVNLLKAVAKAESDFNTNDTSSVGAMGIMQLMPETAKELGVTDAYDAEQNIMGGAKYLSRLLKKYNGDTSLALAAYNAGSGNVDKYGGIPPFKETQNYVKKVLGYMNEGVLAPDTIVTTASSLSNTGALSDNTDSSSLSATESAFNYGNSENVINIIHAQNDSSSVAASASSTDNTDADDIESEYAENMYYKLMNTSLGLLSDSDGDTTSSALSLLLSSDSTSLSDLLEDSQDENENLLRMQNIKYNNSVLKLLSGSTNGYLNE